MRFDREEAARHRERSPDRRRRGGGRGEYRQRSPVGSVGGRDHLTAAPGRRVDLPCFRCQTAGLAWTVNHYHHECKYITSQARRHARKRYNSMQSASTIPAVPTTTSAASASTTLTPTAAPAFLMPSTVAPPQATSTSTGVVVATTLPLQESESGRALHDNLERFSRADE